MTNIKASSEEFDDIDFSAKSETENEPIITKCMKRKLPKVAKLKNRKTQIDDNVSAPVSDCKPTETVHLKVEPILDSNQNIAVVDIEKIIYEQISDKILKMMGSSLKSNSVQVEVPFVVAESVHTVLCSPIYGDGHCLFRSLAHQLWNETFGTKEQIKSTKELRASVVSHIDEHFSDFLWELRGNILDKFGNIPNIEDECKRHLNESLAGNGW